MWRRAGLSKFGVPDGKIKIYLTITCNRIQTDWEIQNVLSGHKKDLFAPNFFIFKRLHYYQYRISKNIEQMLQGRCLKKLIFNNDAMK